MLKELLDRFISEREAERATGNRSGIKTRQRALGSDKGEIEMDKHEEVKLDTNTTADFIAGKLRDPINGDAYFRGYLRAGFLESAVNTLYQVRRQAGLTQAQVAEKLNTKQAAIARLEDDTEGAMSLRRYVDFVIACGWIPYDIALVPIEAVRGYFLENPQAPLMQEDYHAWLLQRETRSTMISQNVQRSTVSNQPITIMTTTTQTPLPAKPLPAPNTDEHQNKITLSVTDEKLSTTSSLQYERLAA